MYVRTHTYVNIDNTQHTSLNSPAAPSPERHALPPPDKSWRGGRGSRATTGTMWRRGGGAGGCGRKGGCILYACVIVYPFKAYPFNLKKNQTHTHTRTNPSTHARVTIAAATAAALSLAPPEALIPVAGELVGVV